MKRNTVSEPFLINPRRKLIRRKRRHSRKNAQLMIVNRARKISHSKLTRRSHSMKRRHSRRARRFGIRRSLFNPMGGGLALDNPRRRRGIRRNPAGNIVMGTVREVQGILPDVGGGIIGFIAVKSIPGMVFPANWNAGVMKIASQGITTIVGSMIVGKVLGRRMGKAVLYGGMIAIGTELVGQLLVKVGVPLSDVAGMGLFLTPETMGYMYQREEMR